MTDSSQIDILLVDDREDGLLAMEAVLGAEDYHLVKATSGHQALSLLDKHEFAMILLDVQMPGIDGFQTASFIRERPGCEHIPIIFVTAINKDDSYVMQGYDAGAVDYLFKPFDPQVLKAKVAVFADLHRKTLQIQKQAELIASIRDRERVHERTRLELESLRRYQNLADAIPHILWKTGPTGALIYCNQGWRDYTGFDIEMNFGVRWRDAFESEDLKRLLKVWLEAMPSGSSFDLECRIIRRDGQLRWHWLKAVAERSEKGEITGWIGTCTDINALKESERRISEARELAESASRAKTDFLANMSHEIRTPLSAILGFSDLLLTPDISLNEKFSYVSTIQNNGKQLLQIVDEVLDVSKVEAGRLELESVVVDTRQFFRELSDSFQLAAADKGLHFTVLPEGALPTSFRTDPVRLRQVIANVISNAIKFTANGFVHVSVSWRELDGSDKPKLCVEARDTGIGIAKQYVDKLFNPFVQGDSSTTRRFGGTGLGLALSRKLARALGGDVWLSESSDFGSVFKIEVAPLESSASTFLGSFSEGSSEGTKAVKAGYPSLENIHVLLAEDVAENQFLIARFLRMAGATVDVASNGIEAVHMALEGQHDVILMDIQMPELDGYEATNRLRLEGYKNPIIALTAHALSAERERCLDGGFNDHIPKPVNRAILLQSIAQYTVKHSLMPHVTLQQTVS
ncbi:MAG: response regulator [Bdellovibrionales bacterium]|nr:response regulator [Bdellovibrionales bacterium]